MLFTMRMSKSWLRGVQLHGIAKLLFSTLYKYSRMRRPESRGRRSSGTVCGAGGEWRVDRVKCLSSSPLGAASALSRTPFHPSLKLEGRSRSGIEDRCMVGMVTRAEQALVV